MSVDCTSRAVLHHVLRAPSPPEVGPDSWGSDGKLDGVLDGPWVIKYEDVLLGMMS